MKLLRDAQTSPFRMNTIWLLLMTIGNFSAAESSGNPTHLRIHYEYTILYRF
jgi:hypothetical protein